VCLFLFLQRMRELLLVALVLAIVRAAAPNCVAYCNALNANCGGFPNSGHDDNSTCIESCGLMSPGSDTDTSGNTAGCRQFHAIAATTNASYHCAAATSNGGGVCGAMCDSWCFFLSQVCAPEFLLDSNTFDLAGCQSVCTALPQDAVSWPVNRASNSVQCRTYHAAAAWVNTTVHCPHACLLGAGVCANATDSPLLSYCLVMNQFCASTYGSASSCMTQAAGISTAGLTDSYGQVSGDNIVCRMHQAAQAYVSASMYCPRAGLVSSVCNANYVFPTGSGPSTASDAFSIGVFVTLVIVSLVLAMLH